MIDTFIAPKELKANRRYRAALLATCRGSPKAQAAVIERCAADIVFYTDTFVWQYNPREGHGRKVAPFILWPFQEDALLRTHRRLSVDRDDALWEKSREMGATWMALILKDWDCLFHDWVKVLAISHSEDAVGRPGDPDTLFWKVNFMHEHLPDWLRRGAARKGRLTFQYPATKSTFTGSATTERSGVGGRGDLLLDEFSKHRQDREILGQTADTGPRLFIGTHYGVEGEFYNLTQRPDLFKVVMHWSQHPEKAKGLYRFDAANNAVERLDGSYEFPQDYAFVTDGTPEGGPSPGVRSVWYDRECLRRASRRDVAMHLDISPSGSQSQFFDPLMLRRHLADHARDPDWEGELEFDREAAEPVRLVPTPGGPLKLWLRLISDREVPPSAYAAGCDISTGFAGRASSNSVLTVADARTGFKVLEFATPHLRPEEFAAAVVALCKLFKSEDGGGAYLAWEHAGPGQMFGKTVLELGYRRLYTRDSVHLLRGGVRSNEPGWYPSVKAKRVLLDDYNAALTSRGFVNRSERALRECSFYRHSDRRDAVEHPSEAGGGDPSGARSNHGDRVIADALCWAACKKLGAGKAQLPEEIAQQSPVGSLQWRMELHAKAGRRYSDAHPIHRHTGVY